VYRWGFLVRAVAMGSNSSHASFDPTNISTGSVHKADAGQDWIAIMFLLPTISVYYIGLKAVFFYMLVHSYVKFDALQRHWLFLSLLYVAGVAFLSFVFLMAPGLVSWTNQQWGVWLAKTLLITAIYFKLLARFDDGVLFWILLVAGVFVVWY
jgi:hypothetical protein